MKLVIFGCGNIAHRIVKGAKLVNNIELVGFGSRDINKAQEYANQYDCPKYGTYEDFLNSDVDAVYVATYNQGHYDLIKECLKHHKHVICEKPMLSSIEMNEELFALAKANNCLLMEAMKSVFLPLNIKIKQMIKDKVIGDVRYMEATFVRSGNHPTTHWINTKGAGGSLKDLGSYCVSMLNFLTDKDPKVLHKYTNETVDKADSFAEVTIDYDGIIGHVVVSNDTDSESALTICGSNGYIRVINFWKVGKGYYVVNNEKHDLEEEMINDFYYELDHFANLVDNNITESPIMSEKASNNILVVTQ